MSIDASRLTALGHEPGRIPFPYSPGYGVQYDILTRLKGIAAGVLAPAILALMAGCGNRASQQVAALNTSNVQRLANLYSAFQFRKGGRGPKDEAEFKNFIKTYPSDKLAMMQVDLNNLDGLFRSERDGQTLKIRYGVRGGPAAIAAVIFEQEGKNGTKQVAYTGTSKVKDVDEATYQEVWAGKEPSVSAAGRPPREVGRRGRPIGMPAGAPKGPQ